MKEIEKYSHLRSLEDKENEEASLALAAQLLFEDGLNSPADDILPFGKSPVGIDAYIKIRVPG